MTVVASAFTPKTTTLLSYDLPYYFKSKTVLVMSLGKYASDMSNTITERDFI